MRKILCTATVLTAAVVAGVGVAPGAGAADGGYVALGDSYTSGPFVTPTDPTSPPLCLRSEVNYPHLVARQLGRVVTDMSCAGATSANMTTSQYPGQPAQFSALSAATSVVTVGIGGNDNNTFAEAVGGCIATDVGDFLNIGAPCRAVFGSTFANAIASDASTIASVLQQVHGLAPNARVFLVGYPDILPQQGSCYPQFPVTTGDVSYLNSVEHDLNAMLQAQATANGATFVDTFTPSLGHDACKAPAVRYVEPPISQSASAPVHPNAAGEAAMAAAVATAIGVA